MKKQTSLHKIFCNEIGFVANAQSGGSKVSVADNEIGDNEIG